MSRIFVGLGSNLGDRERNLAQGVAALARTSGVEVRRRSSLYESEPIGPEQPNFLNAALELQTTLKPEQLLHLCKEIERGCGRVPGPRWGPRPLDIDLLMADEIVALPMLQIPHLELHKRAFALMPLCEIAPDLRHPVLNQSLKLLCEALHEQVVRRVGEFYVDWEGSGLRAPGSG